LNRTVLEVWISVGALADSVSIVLFQENSPIHANEIRSLDDNVVRAINPRSPGVNVSNLSLYANRANHSPHIVDAGGKSVGVAVLPVQVLAADGDGNDPIFAVGGDGVEQGLLLGFEVVDIFGPDTDEDLGAGVEGGGHGVGESVAIRARIEADGCNVLGKALQLVECRGPLGGGLAGSIRVVGGDVETLPVSLSERQRCRKGGDCGGETHRQRCVLKEGSENELIRNGSRGRGKQGIKILRVRFSS
jgi:hypothetical protein